jgi:hypothetical protein
MKPSHYYIQTFDIDPTTRLPVTSSLSALLTDTTLTTDDTLILYISSLHFGTDPSTAKPYLHLNDNDTDELVAFWQDVQRRCEKAVCRVEVRVMLGGAGGAYTTLFTDFETYYNLLHSFLQTHSFISGIDLDIEEQLHTDPKQALARVQKLITRLHHDTKATVAHPFAITMAPVASSLTGDCVGMGGFVYKDFAQSSCGQMISQYNVQAYGSYDYDTFHSIVQNGFAPEQLVFGMLGDDFEQATPFASAMTELQRITKTYPRHGGAILWEYGDTKVDGVMWGQAVRRAVATTVQDMHAVAERCVMM